MTMDHFEVQSPERSPEQMYSPQDAKCCSYPPQFADGQAAENDQSPSLQEPLKNAVLTPVAVPTEDTFGETADGERGTQDPADGDDTDAGNEATPEISAAPKKRRTLPLILAAAAACLVLAIGITGLVYHNRYEEAYALAGDGHYREAQTTLTLPSITELHDPELLRYIDAGILLTDGEYDGARLLLEPLAQQGYLNSAELVLEANYLDARECMRRADHAGAQALLEPLAEAGYLDSAELLLQIRYDQSRIALDRGDWEDAMALLKPLADQDYADSFSLYCEAKLGYAWQLIENTGDYSSVESGLVYMNQLTDAGYAQAQTALEDAYTKIYDHSVSLYQEARTGEAQAYFQLLGDHSRSADYLTLCQAHGLQASLEALWGLRGFADADALLLNEYYLSWFLEGSWSSGSYYCSVEFDGDGSSYSYTLSYNLPWQYSGSCDIEDGVMMIYHNGGSTAYKEFKFTIRSWDEIVVYCYKDSSSHTLYRN